MSNHFKKIDIHCHTTKRKLSHTVSADASLSFISKEMKKYNIEKTLVLATYFPSKGTGISNFRMADWVRAERAVGLNEFVMFGSLDFEFYFKQGLNELEEMAERQLIRGIKIYSGYQKITFGKLMEVAVLAKQYSLPMMFHTGDCTGASGGYADVAEYDDLIEQAQDINFIFSHMANPMIEKVIERVKRYKNVYTDMSGLIHSGKDDHEIPDHIRAVRKFYDECGVGQFMWGTDFPVTTHEHAVQIAEQALHGIATEEELKQFYYGNAAKILNIGASSRS